MALSLRRIKKGLFDQINPFDGGKTFANPNPPAKPQAPAQELPPNLQPRNNAIYPESFYGAGGIRPEKLNNPLAIDPDSTPKSRAIFAPADDTTNRVLDEAKNIYEFTPEFSGILKAAQPQALAERGIDTNGGLKNNTLAAGVYWNGKAKSYSNNQRIELAKGYGSSPQVVAHEGLHAAFDTVPEAKKAFSDVYSRTTNPTIQDYLDRRLGSYPEYHGKQTLSNFSRLDPSIQTEVHSFLGEMPDYGRGERQYQLPPALASYYSRYVNANSAGKKQVQQRQVQRSIMDALDGYQQRRRYAFQEDF